MEKNLKIKIKYSLQQQKKKKKKESTCQCRDRGSIPDQEDPLEEDMATHSSIIAWETPWTEEPGRLQSMQLQKSRTQFSN